MSLRIAVITGSRAEFGLLEPVMRAIRGQEGLELRVVAAGAHFLKPSETWREVEGAFGIDARVPMQRDGETGRNADAMALGRGVEGFARAFGELKPDWVVVLGDRIEAFAAASAGAIGGRAIAHIHGGDRAEGVADESMRHAITKLAHLHFAATPESGARIVAMGEDERRTRVVGSPAVDGLAGMPALDDARFGAVGAPDTLFLMHPVGREADAEFAAAGAALRACAREGRRTLALMPNFDAGREGIARAIEGAGVRTCDHLSRRDWIGLMRRVAAEGGILVGNSSAALIEAAAIRPALPSVDIGPRQAGRERPGSVIRASDESVSAVGNAISSALRIDRHGVAHPYGDGRASARIAAALREIDPRGPGFLRKRNTY